MPWAGDRALSRIVGKHVWAVEGIGGNGVSLSPGIAIDQSASGIQHTASLNQAFRGGPIVNGRGQVVAIASLAYTPLGFPSGDVSFGVPVQTACDRVLSCSGEVPGAA
jgi:S1-C subfamily serine protease